MAQEIEGGYESKGYEVMKLEEIKKGMEALQIMDMFDNLSAPEYTVFQEYLRRMEGEISDEKLAITKELEDQHPDVFSIFTTYADVVEATYEIGPLTNTTGDAAMRKAAEYAEAISTNIKNGKLKPARVILHDIGLTDQFNELSQENYEDLQEIIRMWDPDDKSLDDDDKFMAVQDATQKKSQLAQQFHSSLIAATEKVGDPDIATLSKAIRDGVLKPQPLM